MNRDIGQSITIHVFVTNTGLLPVLLENYVSHTLSINRCHLMTLEMFCLPSRLSHFALAACVYIVNLKIVT